ncbi:MAG: hypothetical protein IPJ19_14385 [Planctomycetes bacterium]|nr:hypothetical protein [Planctomycetota bacterium]
MRTTLALSFVSLALLGFARTARAQTACPERWIPTFGAVPGIDGGLNALATFDDGSGPALFVAGVFAYAGGRPASHIAKWDGSSWSALGSGISNGLATEVDALCVFDDGSGPALIVGGSFPSVGGLPASRVAKWNGHGWHPLGAGLSSYVRALCIYDDGNGPALYAAGAFVMSGQTIVNSIARWNGSAWMPLGAGLNGMAQSLGVYDDGSGPGLYVSGGFTQAGGVPAQGIARWNGSSWSAVGNSATVHAQCMAEYDDGSGSALYAGGSSTLFPGGPVEHLVRWDGASWSSVGSQGPNGQVNALLVHDDGHGPSLQVGGDFSAIGALSARGLARWDGQSWSAVPMHLGASVRALAPYDDGQQVRLAVGGSFPAANEDRMLNSVGLWDGTGWSALGPGPGWDFGAEIVFDDALYLARHSYGLPTRVMKWDGAHLTSLGPEDFDGFVTSFAAFDDGTGRALYASGSFQHIAGASISGVARWDGAHWQPLGLGVDPYANALCVHDDGSGPKLYVAGYFTHAGGFPTVGLARWDGAQWSTIGGISGMGGSAFCILSYDDGSGPALYLGGSFDHVGGVPALRIARWKNGVWSAVGAGFGSGPSCLRVFDDGTGPALYAAGGLYLSGGQPVGGVVRWNGSVWSDVGGGIPTNLGSSFVNWMCVADLGAGARLYVCGSFDSAGGQPVANLASWDGTQWSPLGSGVDGSVARLAVFDDGHGPLLHAAGTFRMCPDSGDSQFARYGADPACADDARVVCEPGQGGVAGCPCANPPSGAGRGCDNSAGTGGASLAASGVARLSNDTLSFASSGELPSATSIVLQGDTLGTGAVFGQGVRCASGTLRRLYTKTAVAGAISAPQAGDASVSARSAALGDPIAQGTQRVYGVMYRDPIALGGCPFTSHFNVTQQLSVLWYP